MLTKWDYRFLELAELVSTWSKDPNKKVGCAVVSPDRRQVSYGYNGLPANVADLEQRLDDRALKNELTVHAELNALLNARRGIVGWTLYTTSPPCLGCAKSIIQAGVIRVVTTPLDPGSSWWVEHVRAQELLREADVRVAWHDSSDDEGTEA